MFGLAHLTCKPSELWNNRELLYTVGFLNDNVDVNLVSVRTLARRRSLAGRK